ncbi:16S rRNA (guanine(527)-N(7))-methyltransferase RsmG [Novosphingobium sp. UBA6272]|uniref:16S rRNA (guanine(527)-N(7))-methyltransferase RsmG n=1 Tax=Novosphingobium sp. UBA6272 TaxID=1946984 RepID=UPI0039C93C03
MLADEAAARDWFRSLPEWSDAVQSRLDGLTALLAAENEVQNLVSESSLQALWVRHYADSAQLLAHVPRETGSPWLDLGSGAGFPGLVIAILRPECEVVMVESRARRINWLQRVCDSLGLTNAKVASMRVEALETRQFRAISARAFAPLPKLLDLSARFSTSDTVWLLPKGRSARQELLELKGWNHLFHVEQSLTDADSGVIVGTLEGRKGKKP